MRSLGLALVLAPVAAAGCTALLGDFSLSSSSQDGGITEAGVDGAPADGGGGGDDTGTSSETGGGEGGPGADGGDAAPTWSCTMDSAHQRSLNGDGGTISADNLYVYRGSQSQSVALVKTGGGPGLAYQFRWDRPGDAPRFVALSYPDAGSVASGTAHLISSARSLDGTATYVLADDQQGDLLFYDWPDTNQIDDNPTAAQVANNIQSGTMIPVGAGMFYGIALNTGTYVDFPSTLFPPQPTTSVSMLDDTGIGDGARLYRLSDDSVMFLYHAPGGSLQQAHYPQHSTTPSTTRTLYSGQVQPVSFQTDGTSVDVAVALPVDEAGTSYGLFTATMSESQLFTFNLPGDLKAVPMGVPLTTQPCLATYPGKLAALMPSTSGMNFILLDAATGTVAYSLTGASNLLHGDSAIVSCAITPAAVTPTELVFDVVWTENTGSGENLLYAPLNCTAQ